MTLFEALLDLARRLTTTREGNATAVATTYIEDSNKAFGVDEYNNGTLFLKDTTPRFLTVTDTTAVRLTFATTTAPAAGVGYAVVNRDYPLDVLLGAINAAVKDLYAEVGEDDTLDTDGSLTDYALPSGVSDILTVEVETPVPSLVYGPGPTYFVEHHHWHEVDGELRFIPGTQPRLDDRAIRLTYRVRPADLDAADDDLPLVDYELMLWKAVAHALRWGLQKYGQDPDRRIVDRLNEAQQEIARRGGNKRTYQKAVRLGAW
jgi:hypothetical protein